ncbi:MAG: nitroreductase family protein [Dehalococcoidia bacterium]
MDAYTCIRTKRDSRNYTGQAIPEETAQRILQAGRMAGSSKNTQPWAFVVLRDQARKAELAACGQFATHVPSAPLVVAVVLLPNGGEFDGGRAAQNMMLAAWAEGITSCPVAMHDRECASKVLGLPEGHRVSIVIAFGYPESEQSLHRGVARTPLPELVHEERW